MGNQTARISKEYRRVLKRKVDQHIIDVVKGLETKYYIALVVAIVMGAGVLLLLILIWGYGGK